MSDPITHQGQTADKINYRIVLLTSRGKVNKIKVTLLRPSIKEDHSDIETTLCTFSRKSSFRKWSPYTRYKLKRFLKSPGIHCRIKAFWRLAIDPHWCVDIYNSGRRVWQITFACFFFSYSNYSQHKCETCFDSSYRNITLDLITIFFIILYTYNTDLLVI